MSTRQRTSIRHPDLQGLAEVSEFRCLSFAGRVDSMMYGRRGIKRLDSEVLEDIDA